MAENPSTPEECVEILRVVGELGLWGDSEGMFAWRAEGNGVRFIVNCSDLFMWGCADSEPLTAADLPELRRAAEDLRQLKPGACFEVYALELWCCRKRGYRPQLPVHKRFGDYPDLHALFDSCGPCYETMYWARVEERKAAKEAK